MSRADKRLEAMRRNPKADWTMADVEVVCRRVGVSCEPPTGGGSHFTVSHESQAEILTVPYGRPIKPFYIRELVAYLDAVISAREADEGAGDDEHA